MPSMISKVSVTPALLITHKFRGKNIPLSEKIGCTPQSQFAERLGMKIQKCKRTRIKEDHRKRNKSYAKGWKRA
jgi:hypothetical protein